MYCSIRNITNNINLINDEYLGEVILDGTEYTIGDIINLSKKYARVVYDLGKVETLDENHIKDFKILTEARENVVFCVSSISRLNTFLQEKLPVFLTATNASVADSVERLYVLGKAGVTDVYVGGELGFNMAVARRIADELNIKIRVIPNMASVSGFTNWFENRKALTDFWIRPEDLYQYEPYVDYIEFAGDDRKQAVLYDIYFISKQWRGILSQVIDNLEPIDNRGLLPQFTEARLNCGKKCMLNKCHSCQKHIALCKLVIENNLKLELEESI